jgi:phage terminase large subunit-like protein
VNNGGELVERNVRALDASIAFRAVRASRGKYTRAEPVAALYERGMVHHLGSFQQLEDQMCSFVPGSTDRSPDRLDALVWAITDLVIDPAEESYRMIQPIEVISPI